MGVMDCDAVVKKWSGSHKRAWLSVGEARGGTNAENAGVNSARRHL